LIYQEKAVDFYFVVMWVNDQTKMLKEFEMIPKKQSP
jgi:hypothetical protein